MQLYIDTRDTAVEVKNACFFIKNKTTQKIISPKRIESIGILSNIHINTSAIKLAAKHEIPIYFYNSYGRVEAELSNPNYLKHSKLRYKQVIFSKSNDGKNWIIHQLILKTKLQLQTIERYKRETPLSVDQKNELSLITNEINKLKIKIENTNLNNKTFRNTLMAFEGNIAKQYFKAINYYLPKEFVFAKRTRKPAKDMFNAGLNYLYGMTYGQVTTAVKAVGLDVYVGVLHTTPYKESMVFDCIESIRPLVDRFLIDLCRNCKLTKKHFLPRENGYWIGKEGKKILLPSFAEYLSKKLKVNNKILTLKNHIFWQSRSLKQIIMNYDVPDNL